MSNIKSNLLSIIEKSATPILVAVVGFWLNSSVQETQAEITKLQTEMELKIAPIKEMKPYMDMLSDTSITKNILGAYSIYMLNKGDDSRIAAQMIASMQKDYLVDILRTLGKDDDSVQKVLDELGANKYDLTALEYASFDESARDTLNLSPMQRYALEVRGSIEQNKLQNQDLEDSKLPMQMSEVNSSDHNIIMNKKADGWIYLGEGKKLIIDAFDGADTSRIYTLNSATNLRDEEPKKENGYLGRKIRIVDKGTKIKVESYTIDKSRNNWAQIKIILKVDELVDKLFSANKDARNKAAWSMLSNIKENPFIVKELLNRVETCLGDMDSSIFDCTNGVYNAGIVLSNLEGSFIKSVANIKPDRLSNITDNIPEENSKTKELFKKVLKTVQ
ncbi:MAG: hypothetical protein HKP38_11480 [Croceitalea sp.]|nr:hypothetical protein [Croceitalea sp.]NNL09834.1 hypothetical protein [Croceitalea sp.]NNM17439.1 hypothetical protein [Croceitalea sp.]